MAVMIGMEKPEMDEESSEKSPDYEGPEISLPAGYTPPDDAVEGEDVSVLCKMRIKPNGKACLVSVDGAPYEKEEAVEETTEEAPVQGGEDSGISAADTGAPLSERIGAVQKKMQNANY